jgi:hypothetical protein
MYGGNIMVAANAGIWTTDRTGAKGYLWWLFYTSIFDLNED